MPVHIGHHGHHQQPAWQQQQTQETPTHHTLTNVIPLQDLHEDTNISHNSSGDDFQHLFSPLKFLSALDSEREREQHAQGMICNFFKERGYTLEFSRYMAYKNIGIK